MTKPFWISAAMLLTLFSGSALSQPSYNWHFIGTLEKLNVYINMNDIACRNGDFLVTVLEDYQRNSISGTKSAVVFYLVNTEQNIYFGLHGFDYTEHMGQGTRMHFEFNPNYAELRKSFNNRQSWLKARTDNVGATVIQFLKGSGHVCTKDSNNINIVTDHRTLPLDIPLR